LKVPDCVGVPEIVIIPADQVALTPNGKPLLPETPEFAMPVAPVVEWVIFVRGVLMQRVGVEDGPETVLFDATVMVPVAFIKPQPPVKGIE
jgi:hypothetical protein